MAHNLEILEDDSARMAYTRSGGTPWHRLGTPVGDDLTPREMQVAAGCDWNVVLSPITTEINGTRIVVENKKALIRDIDNKVLDVVGSDWLPVQNDEAFEMFDDIVKAGGMTMETAGSLDGGRVVFVLAKTNHGFRLFSGRDENESYVLLANFLKYGRSMSCFNTGIRVVCENTLNLSFACKKNESEMSFTQTHRTKFNAERAKNIMKINEEATKKYAEMAQFLGSKRLVKGDDKKIIAKLFPTTSEKKDMSLAAERCLSTMETQPGAEFGQGTYWQVLNAITYYATHKHGRDDDTRLASSTVGPLADLKVKAVDLVMKAAEMA